MCRYEQCVLRISIMELLNLILTYQGITMLLPMNYFQHMVPGFNMLQIMFQWMIINIHYEDVKQIEL